LYTCDVLLAIEITWSGRGSIHQLNLIYLHFNNTKAE